MTRQRARLGIVVGVDGSASATAAIKWAARDAVLRNVPLRLVHVVPTDPALTETGRELCYRVNTRNGRGTGRARSSRTRTRSPSKPPCRSSRLR